MLQEIIQLYQIHINGIVYYRSYNIAVGKLYLFSLIKLSDFLRILVLSDFTNLHSSIKKENPYVCFFTGDFNSKSQLWWPDADTSPEETGIENLLTQLGLTQVITEPTNFEPNKNPSCIDLVITDQPNLILDSGTRLSLDSFCYHQIIYCKANINLPPPPPYEREIWHYHRANVTLLRRSMSNFPWLQHLNIYSDPNWQTKTFTKIFLNIMSNFIPHETKNNYTTRSPMDYKTP